MINTILNFYEIWDDDQLIMDVVMDVVMIRLS